jgi:cytochrome c-type biogenesis protein CcmH
MKKILLLAALCLPFIWSSQGQAKEAEYTSGDPEIHNRVMSVSEELRCLVCQGQSLADSNSDFAKDMRVQIQEMMEEGMSDRQVVDFMVERYGDYVRYRPPFKATTVLLWFGPFILLGIGVAVLYSNVLRRRKQIEEIPLTEEEHRRAAELLKEGSGENKA